MRVPPPHLTQGLKHAELTEQIIRVFYDVYNELGYGFAESVYQNAFAVALKTAGLDVEREFAIPVYFRHHVVGQFRADLTVGGRVIVETKTCRVLDSSHEAQLLNYLRATEMEVGLLFNFGPRPQFRRLLFDNDRKRIRENPCLSVAEVLQ